MGSEIKLNSVGKVTIPLEPMGSTFIGKTNMKLDVFSAERASVNGARV